MRSDNSNSGDTNENIVFKFILEKQLKTFIITIIVVYENYIIVNRGKLSLISNNILLKLKKVLGFAGLRVYPFTEVRQINVLKRENYLH